MPVESMHDELYSEYSFLLDKTSRRIKQYAQKKFNEFNFGVTVDQWIILKQLYQNCDMHQSELAEITFKGTPTLTRIVDILCEKGLTQRVMDPTDRRKFKVYLTLEGHQKVEAMMPKVSQIRKAAWANLQSQDFEHFKYVLKTIYKNLEI